MNGFVWCCHWETTPLDEDGASICVKCGRVLEGQVLTEALLRDTFTHLHRQALGHTMTCVDTDLGWCCAIGCRVAEE